MMNRSNIPENLTYEEFERLANREPNLEGDYIYRLTQLFVDTDKLKNPYPKFDLDYKTSRLFMSFEDAKRFLDANKGDDVYCSWITQIPNGASIYEHSAEWFYDKDGNLLDYSVQKTYGDHDDLEFCFFGRPTNRQRFKKGDIVEVVSDDDVSLAVLTGNVADVEWCWNYYKRTMADKRYPYYGLDFTDESTCVIEGPSYCYHSHPSPLCLMKPRFPLPLDLETEMKTWKERADKETEEDRNNYPSQKNGSKTVDYDDYVASGCYDFNIYFKFNEEGELLLLLDDKYGLRVSLRTETPEYADYKDFTGRLVDSQLKALQDYLEKEDVSKSKWWYLLRKWNQDNEEKQIPLDTPLPDYTTLIQKKL